MSLKKKALLPYADFPENQLGASLKRSASRNAAVRLRAKLPREPTRGLIEAVRHGVGVRQLQLLPREPTRGLIEAHVD